MITPACPPTEGTVAAITRTVRYPFDRMQELIPVVQAGKYDLVSILSHRLPLAEGSEAYRLFDEKRDGCIKVVLTTT